MFDDVDTYRRTNFVIITTVMRASSHPAPAPGGSGSGDVRVRAVSRGRTAGL